MATYNYNNTTQLSPHFNITEFKCKCGGTHSTILDTNLVTKLEALHSTLNCSSITINSGYRCPTHDKNVGGTGYGQHTKGVAADIICYDKNKKPINPKIISCVAQDLGFTGIGRINTTNSTHVDVRTYGIWKGDETLGAAGTNYSVTSDFYNYYKLTKADVYGTSSAAAPNSTTNSAHSWSNKYSVSIKELQKILNSKGAGLTTDGIAGEKTLAAARKYTINSGDKGELTKWVQTRLNQLGFNCGIADGIAGANTMSAIMKFQKANNLGTGYLGGEDWYYLIKD